MKSLLQNVHRAAESRSSFKWIKWITM